MTSLKLLFLPLIWYSDRSSRWAMRVTTTSEPGTTSNSPSPAPRSTTSSKTTLTLQCARSMSPADLWMSWDTFFCRSCLARFPHTNSSASITLLFPLPFGPTTALNRWWKGPTRCCPA